MGIAIGAGVVAASSAYSAYQGGQAAHAMGDAASAAAEAARKMYGEAKDYGQALEDRVGKAAMMSPQELMAYGNSLDAAQRTVDSDKALLSAIDPALMEASQQALKLLRGEDAASIGPLKQQRQAQRDQLLRTLREQLGPGAETSSAGIQALNQFDMETSSLLSGTQQSTLGTLLGTAQQSRTNINSDIGTLNNTGIAFGNASNRYAQSILSAGTATLGAMTGTSQSVVNSAGSPFVSQLAQAQGNMGIANQFSQIGGTLLGYGLQSAYAPKKT